MKNIIQHLLLTKKIHPLFYVTIAFLFGISWYEISKTFFASSIIYYFLITFAISAWLACHISKKNQFKAPFYLIGAFAFGSILLHHQYKQHEYMHKIFCKNHFDIIGTITNITKQPHLRTKYRITLSTKKIKQLDMWKPINTCLYIYIQQISDIQVGDTLKIKNLSCKKTTNSSFTQYLIKEGISCTIFSYKLNYKLVYRPTISLYRLLFHQKERLLKSLNKKLAPKTFPFFSSLFLGNKSICKKELETTVDQFKTWGILHYLARSGLHLVIFILVWEICLCLIPTAFIFKQFFILFLSILYFLLSWTSLSFLRAFYIFVLYKFCVLFKKQTHFIHLLTLVCLFTLLTNPIQLLFLDFQLSFSLTFALASFNHIYRTQKV